MMETDSTFILKLPVAYTKNSEKESRQLFWRKVSTPSSFIEKTMTT